MTAKITDIYATSVDYNINSPTTKDFFANVQNKLHFAIHQNTAAGMYLDYANRQARKFIPMTMKDWKTKLVFLLGLGTDLVRLWYGLGPTRR